MLSFLFRLTLSSAIYSLTASELTISGTGTIDQKGARSKGVYTRIITVLIKDGPSTIDAYAFERFDSLKYIYIPKSIQTIKDYVFRCCYSLTKIEVDPASTYFCNDAQFFLYSKNMTRMVMAVKRQNPNIPEGVEEIENNAFTINNFNFGTLELPTTVTNIKMAVFDCSTFDSISFKKESTIEILQGFIYTKVTTITIPSSVTTISSGAFRSSWIENLIFEDNSKIEAIDENSFNAIYIDEINLPNSVQNISDYAFVDSSVKIIRLGTGCSNISINAFASCKDLKSIVVAEGNTHFTSVEGVLMDKNEELLIFIPGDKQKITVSSKVKKIGQTSLQSASSLTEIVLESNEIWNTAGGVLYSKDFTVLFAVFGGIQSIEVDARVKIIDKYAAYSCSSLKNITFLGGLVETIGFKAFCMCGITSFELPDSVININREAFTQAENLTSFTVNPESKLKNIYLEAFKTSGLTSYYFGKDVIMIEPGIFIGCKSIKSITFHPDINITSLGYYGFESTGITSLLLPASLTTISPRCFRYCKSLQYVHFKEGSVLESIGEVAFYQCIILAEVILPDTCLSLDNQAFALCESLTTFTHNLETINSAAFYYCINLATFNFSSRQIETLDTGIFMNCHNLIEYNVAGNDKLKCINGDLFNHDETILKMFPPGKETALIPPRTQAFADNAFYGSSKLKFVAFYSGSELKTIGSNAFYECKKLENVQFPAKLTHIKTKSFFGCTSLKSIRFPDSLEFIDESAFIGCNNVDVRYCGTHFVQGENVFEKNVKVLVTDLYPNTTFCSINVEKKLSYNCDIMPIFNKVSCGYNKVYNPNVFDLIAVFIINSE